MDNPESMPGVDFGSQSMLRPVPSQKYIPPHLRPQSPGYPAQVHLPVSSAMPDPASSEGVPPYADGQREHWRSPIEKQPLHGASFISNAPAGRFFTTGYTSPSENCPSPSFAPPQVSPQGGGPSLPFEIVERFSQVSVSEAPSQLGGAGYSIEKARSEEKRPHSSEVKASVGTLPGSQAHQESRLRTNAQEHRERYDFGRHGGNRHRSRGYQDRNNESRYRSGGQGEDENMSVVEGLNKDLQLFSREDSLFPAIDMAGPSQGDLKLRQLFSDNKDLLSRFIGQEINLELLKCFVGDRLEVFSGMDNPFSTLVRCVMCLKIEKPQHSELADWKWLHKHHFPVFEKTLHQFYKEILESNEADKWLETMEKAATEGKGELGRQYFRSLKRIAVVNHLLHPKVDLEELDGCTLDGEELLEFFRAHRRSRQIAPAFPESPMNNERRGSSGLWRGDRLPHRAACPASQPRPSIAVAGSSSLQARPSGTANASLVGHYCDCPESAVWRNGATGRWR